MALLVMVSFFAYLRPAEARALLVRHLVAPNPAMPGQAWFSLLLHDADIGIHGKTGMTDDSVSLDSLAFMNDIFSLILAHRDPNEALFNFPAHRFNKLFARACVELNLGPLKPSLYALRHGGASDDLHSKARTALEVQLRGRWRTAASLRRYGKAVRLATQLAKIPKAVVDFGLQIENQVLSLFLACGRPRNTAPAPPKVSRAKPK